MSIFTNRSAAFGLRALAGAVVLAGALGVAARASARGHTLTVSLEDDETIQNCDQIRPRFEEERDSLPMARAERSFTLAQSATPLLEMHLKRSGGIALSGWDRTEFAVTACLAAGARSDARAADILNDIAVGFEGGRLAIDGPDGEDWIVYLIVRVPNDAALDLLSENAPIDLREVSGRIKARTENGPISLTHCRGEIDVQVENGPLSVQAGGGRQHLSTRNGPLAISLEGRRWDGEGIEASAVNGPVSLEIPDHYQSGVQLVMSRHAPLRCRSAGCDGAGGLTGDGSRRLDFGSTPPVIRVTAGNGPVDVQSGTPGHRTPDI